MAKTKTKKNINVTEVSKADEEAFEKAKQGSFIVYDKDTKDAVMESIARPFDKTVEINEELNETYPFALRDLTGVQRAILCELVRIRKALEK